MAGIMRYDGSKWVENNTINRYNATKKAWEKAEVYRYNGSSWVKISEERKVKTFECTWSQSYSGRGEQKPLFLDSRGVAHQGRYGAPYTQDWDWGIQKSMIGFDDASIRRELSGAKIEKVEIYLRNKHFWYYGGGYAMIGYHNISTRPAKFSSSKNSVLKEYYTGRGAGKWLEMPLEFGTLLRDNKAKGFTLYAPTEILDYYGYFYGASGGTSKPKIRITYVN